MTKHVLFVLAECCATCAYFRVQALVDQPTGELLPDSVCMYHRFSFLDLNINPVIAKCTTDWTASESAQLQYSNIVNKKQT